MPQLELVPCLSLRLSGSPRPAWRPPGCVRKRGRACFPGSAPRAGIRARLPGSRRSGGTQCVSGGHEHRCAGLRRWPHRSCRQWAPALARFPSHHRQPNHAGRRGAAWGCRPSRPDASDAKPTPSLSAPVTAAWWLLVSKSEAGSVPKQPRGYACLRAAVHLRPPQPCRPLHGPHVARWSGLLTVAGCSAFAASLLELPLAGECSVGGEAPELLN